MKYIKLLKLFIFFWSFSAATLKGSEVLSCKLLSVKNEIVELELKNQCPENLVIAYGDLGSKIRAGAAILKRGKFSTLAVGANIAAMQEPGMLLLVPKQSIRLEIRMDQLSDSEILHLVIALDYLTYDEFSQKSKEQSGSFEWKYMKSNLIYEKEKIDKLDIEYGLPLQLGGYSKSSDSLKSPRND